ncbi:MAG: DUF1009 domain-containing protein [Rickettsiales bacterium]|nr:MAG: DUF1009 domain-containing protein [Rickettsiales bacterium]
MLPILGIIAGNGELPHEINQIYNEIGGKCVVAYIGKEDKPWNIKYQNFAIGSVGNILKYFNEQNVKNIIIVGSIDRPNLKSLKVDLVGSSLLAKIMKMKFLGDDNILRIVSDFIESKGFKVISPQQILKSYDYEKNMITKISPSSQNLTDINLGCTILRSLGSVDVGQSVIMCNGYTLGIEAAEGTDNLIKRCAILRKINKGGVLVKMHKFNQDIRLDTPTIGPQTIINLSENGFNGIAIDKQNVLIVQPKETLKLLNDKKLFLAFVSVEHIT